MNTATELRNQTKANILEDLQSDIIMAFEDRKSQHDILSGDIGPETITDLEETRDAALAITWYFHKNLQGTKDLIRDCTQIDDSAEKIGEAEIISYQIQAVNTLLAAQKVFELEGHNSNLDELEKMIVSIIDTEIIQEFNVHAVQVLKNAGVSDAKDKLKTARDFVSMDCQQFHVTTITKQIAKGEDKILIETDTMLLGLTDSQKCYYTTIANDSSPLPDWYTELPEFDQKIVKSYSNRISEGKVMLPTQSRKHLPGLRNAYEKSVFVADPNGDNMELVLAVLHSGTPSFHGKGDKALETKHNLQHLKSFAGDKNINDNPLNSPQMFGVIPNFVNYDDRDAPGLIKEAQILLGGSTTVTPLNGLRRFTYNDNTGFVKALREIGKHLKDNKSFQAVSDYLIDGKNSQAAETALDVLKKVNSEDVVNEVNMITTELIQALQNAIKVKKLTLQPAGITESENQNLELVSNMCLVDFACNNENGSLKKYLPGLNTEKLNVHCASGKDRTGIVLASATNQAVSQNLGLDEVQAQSNLKTQISGRHHQLLASINGGTPGCHGVKSDSKTALSEKNPLNALIERTAGSNKFKTPKTWKNRANSIGLTISTVVAIAAVDSYSYSRSCFKYSDRSESNGSCIDWL